jgi:site-specific DNA-methyltransferase (adenine-specific)
MIDQIRCSDYQEFLRQVPDVSVGLLLSDPPFGIGYQNNYTHDMHDVMVGDAEKFSYQTLAEESFRVLRDNSAILVYTGWSEYPTHYKELEAAGFTMQEPLIVQKRPSGKTNLYGTFQTNADWIMFGHKGKFRFRETQLMKNKRAGTVPNIGRKPVSKFKRRLPACWFGEEYPWSSENPVFQKKHDLKHPTIKTVRVMEWLIQLATDEGDTILDPFCGTGPVAVAASRLKRHFLCCDISQKFCDFAEYRLRRNI